MENIMDEKGQMILLFAFVVVIVVLTLSYVYAQNIIAGVESSRAMLAFPKEEIRNLEEIQKNFGGDSEVNSQIQTLCAKNGWVCYVGVDKVEFKNVEVDYCAGSDC
ncbi:MULTISPECIES: hypothetical protein [Archaeoglobus]|jgi:uncharacterized protein (UPF0333 family)|uniref:Uncharacterized protein AF_0761 n=3 Tax=Archaeoglobus fulgidus TaxID=2234 RepID=Y761_ARCFU|nr:MULTISPECIES: hypothetical protein [Archaeoglobus]O29497.1 RecName: Full=Uncharacterized protein AF_0761 [Archaeoglobus fulgidus DSM 4304]AAB90484.1 predicted coding region AF_0761 [Archaeoglobus fulgidus DSM 4304]AIG97637.1 hypothetical protein AFULGI_00008420 [Archaeoglobus fulgidus DSM 8774]KUJ93532.1 MAG: hypothetical protein XD40_1309 [Archaeoglobus fulgidus]KUK07131.1 MAG: Uncharacterized protein XD48_0670 [Archaeoglobus fulgidus]MDI3496862.1 hypothetical protein [Archaeoglobus sp.]